MSVEIPAIARVMHSERGVDVKKRTPFFWSAKTIVGRGHDDERDHPLGGAVCGFVAECGSMTTESPGLDRLLSPFSAKKHGILARDTQSGPHEALRDLCG